VLNDAANTRDNQPSVPVCPYCGDGMNSVGTLNHIECVRALTDHLVEIEDELSDSRRREQLLQGALDAQTERDLAACERAGEPWFDGDTADHLADLLVEEREARMRAEAEISERDARRCDNCLHWSGLTDMGLDIGDCEATKRFSAINQLRTPDTFSCSWWTARSDDGSKS